MKAREEAIVLTRGKHIHFRAKIGQFHQSGLLFLLRKIQGGRGTLGYNLYFENALVFEEMIGLYKTINVQTFPQLILIYIQGYFVYQNWR